jgi:hypothetical protein
MPKLTFMDTTLAHIDLLAENMSKYNKEFFFCDMKGYFSAKIEKLKSLFLEDKSFRYQTAFRDDKIMAIVFSCKFAPNNIDYFTYAGFYACKNFQRYPVSGYKLTKMFIEKAEFNKIVFLVPADKRKSVDMMQRLGAEITACNTVSDIPLFTMLIDKSLSKGQGKGK